MPLEKQYWMLKAFLLFLRYGRESLRKGHPIEQLLASPFRGELEQMKEAPPDNCVLQAQTLIEKMEQELGKP